MYALSLPAAGTIYLKMIGFGITLCCRKPVVKMQRSLNAH